MELRTANDSGTSIFSSPDIFNIPNSRNKMVLHGKVNMPINIAANWSFEAAKKNMQMKEP